MESFAGRAAAELVEIKAHDLRRWTSDKHHVVDDRPFGGGDGMVLKPEPIFAAVNDLTGSERNAKSYPSQNARCSAVAAGSRVYARNGSATLRTNSSHVVLICGRYEGVDERVAEALVTDEISIGDYVLSGGEPAALVVVDAIVRLSTGRIG